MIKLLFSAIVLILFSCVPIQAATYTVKDLGTFTPSDINSSGWVVGDNYKWIPSSSNSTNGALYQIDSPDPSPYAYSAPKLVAINDSGIIAGSRQYVMTSVVDCVEYIDESFRRPSVWDIYDSSTDLGTFSNGDDPALGPTRAPDREALGINSLGTVVGFIADCFWGGDNGGAYGFVTTNYGFSKTVIYSWEATPYYGLSSSCFDVNSADQVVGWASKLNDSEDPWGGYYQKAFLVQSNSNSKIDLGGLNGSTNYPSIAYGINSGGKIVGRCDLDGSATSAAFIWEPSTANGSSGTMRNLGLLSGSDIAIAFAINDSDITVGWCYTLMSGAYSGFIVDASSSTNSLVALTSLMTDTNWVITKALNINNSGQIIGKGYNVGAPSNLRTLLLTPQ